MSIGKFKIGALIGAMLGLSGCLSPVMAPVEAVEKVQQPAQEKVTAPVEQRKVVKNQAIYFVCNNNQPIQITQNRSEKKVKVITLTFDKTSHKLSSAVTRNGKKYSNIRWVWTEDAQGIGTLRDHSQKILAYDCKKNR